MKKNNLIMFDCFGVVSTCVLPPFFAKRFGKEKGKELETYYCNKGDRGEYTLMDIAIEVSKLTGENPEEIYKAWIEGTVVEPALIDYILKLKEENYVVLASNCMKGLVEDVFKKHDLYHLFDKIFISYLMGDVKPHKSYYQKIINSFDIKFEKIYMIDDRPINLSELKDIGVEGILYQGVEDLKARLKL